jgi:hypothetical protein
VRAQRIEVNIHGKQLLRLVNHSNSVLPHLTCARGREKGLVLRVRVVRTVIVQHKIEEQQRALIRLVAHENAA